MTKYELFTLFLPQITEIAEGCCKMDRLDYEDWKRRVMEHTHEKARLFMRDIISIVDRVVLGK